MQPNRRVWSSDAANVIRGLLMGGADIIPGVSGGTVALILGIYARLVTAIGRIDHRFVKLLLARELRQAATHADLRFLVALLFGIALGIISLGELSNHLLSSATTRPMTLAAFFGMIVASTIVVARRIRINRRSELVSLTALAIAGAALAYWVTGLPTTSASITLPYIFVCGIIAICAMILPGISGAYLLLILGVYIHLTDILKSLRLLNIGERELLTVLIFGSGCALGIISFSKLLGWLLATVEPQTMAVLAGFMVGALRKIWPFQQPLNSVAEEVAHPQLHNVLPQAIDGQLLACLACAGIGFAIVFFLQYWSHTSADRFRLREHMADRAA